MAGSFDGALLHRAVFESIGDAILVADKAGRFLDANPAAVELLGYSREELSQMRVLDLSGGGDWTEADWAWLLHQGYWRSEHQLRRKDGALIRIEAELRAVALPSGPVYISSIRQSKGASEPNRSYSRVRNASAD